MYLPVIGTKFQIVTLLLLYYIFVYVTVDTKLRTGIGRTLNTASIAAISPFSQDIDSSMSTVLL